jgi:flagella basal body P-ring formation protein FlgA
MKFSFLEAKLILQIFVTTVIAGALASPSYSYETISGATLKTLVNKMLLGRDFVGNPEINDDRSFKACGSDIVIEPLFGGFKTVRLTCPDEDGFKLAVKTNAMPKKKMPEEFSLFSSDVGNHSQKPKVAFQQIVALTKSVSRGEILSEADVKVLRVKNKANVGYFVTTADVIGRKTKRALSVGDILLNRHLEPNWDIKENQKVIIETRVGSLVVSTLGTAIANGQIGELLLVKNHDSGTVVEGEIISEKKINVIAK